MPFQSTPLSRSGTEATESVTFEDARDWLLSVVFPGKRLMGELSPSGDYVAVAPGVIQSIEENRARHAETRRMVAAGKPVAWKWGV